MNGLVGPDIHELNTPNAGDGSSFIQDVYQSTPMDLSEYGGPSDGAIWDGCFQEVDFNTRETIFQWCASESGIGLNESYVYPSGNTMGLYVSPISGAGTTDTPWDYV